MESIVNYKRLLLLHSATSSLEDREPLATSCLELLKQLHELDPQRKNRYTDLGV